MRMIPQGKFCAHHADQGIANEGLLLAIGAFLGNAVAPGLGGAAAAKAASMLFEPKVRRRKVFVSFDFDNNQKLKHLLIGQARHPDSPFDVIDGSLQEAAPEHNWQSKARQAIRRCDIVVVLLGKDTYRAKGVLAEIEIAREEGKPVVQLIGQRGVRYRRVQGGGKVVAWTWPNLRALFE